MDLTGTEIIAIIVTIGAVFVSPILNYLTLKATKEVGETAKRVGETAEAVAVDVKAVKHEANNKTTALTNEIAGLRQRVAELIKDRDNVTEVAKLTAAATTPPATAGEP